MDKNRSPSHKRRKSNKVKKNVEIQHVIQPIEVEGNIELTEENVTNVADPDNEVQVSAEEDVKSCHSLTRQKRRSRHLAAGSKPYRKREVPDTVITAVLEDLNDDVVDEPPRLETGDYSLVEPISQTPVSLPPDKVYVERKNGFATKPRIKMFQPLNYTEESRDNIQYSKSVGTPLELAILIQKCCRPLYMMCHGLLGGMALLHIILVYGAGSFYSQDNNFISMYINYARIYQTLFHILSILCLISIMDSCDLKHMDLNHMADLCRYHFTTVLALLVYFVTIVLTFVTTKWDDWLAHFSHPGENILDKADKLEVWLTLNLCRSIGAIFGWILVAFFPAEDMLHLHLYNMLKYQTVTSHVVPARY